MKHDRRWAAALDEHETALRTLLSECERIPSERWHESPAPGTWSPALVVLHVCKAYELARDAINGGARMRLVVTPRRAWVLRILLLPAILLAKRFPRGVRAPREVRPDADAATRLTRDGALARLGSVAREAAQELRRADDLQPVPRVTHAYFGVLSPRSALRVLSAHTRHHARGLARLVFRCTIL